MQSQRHRARAAFRLSACAILAAGFAFLPQSMPYLRKHQHWINAARAAVRGASLVDASGLVRQVRGNDCGPACLKMVLAAHGIERSLSSLTDELTMTARGTSMLNLRMAAGRSGLPARSWSIRWTDLRSMPVPAIVLINRDHFVVIRRLVTPEVLEVDDPALGRLHWPIRSFRKVWEGQAMIFDPAWVPSHER